jgi:formate C-acetyltransferase
MRAVLDTYMSNNGLAIQFNVFNTDTLYDAQKHPEKYENLQVRVCGWNVLWNNLSRDEQNAYILRCENIQ